MDLTALRSPDDAFWMPPAQAKDRLATELVGHYRGVVVDAPRRVALDRRQTFPLRVYQVGTIRELSQVRFEQQAVIAVMNVTTNTLYAVPGNALDREERAPSPPRPAPEKFPEGDMSSTKSIELRELLELSWTPSRYVLSAFIHGQVSNRVAVELCATAKACVPKDPSTLQQVALTARVAGGKRVLEGTYAASPAAGKSADGHVVWVVLTRPDGELLNVLDLSTRGALQDGLARGAFSTDVQAVLRRDSKEPLHAWAFTGEAFVGPIDVPVK